MKLYQTLTALLLALAIISLGRALPPHSSPSAQPNQERDDQAGALRDWTPADSVPIRKFLRIPGDIRNDSELLPYEFSPDMRYFYLLSEQDDFGQDCRVQKLEVFDVAVIKAWRPRRRARHLPRLRHFGQL